MNLQEPTSGEVVKTATWALQKLQKATSWLWRRVKLIKEWWQWRQSGPVISIGKPITVSTTLLDNGKYRMELKARIDFRSQDDTNTTMIVEDDLQARVRTKKKSRELGYRNKEAILLETSSEGGFNIPPEGTIPKEYVFSREYSRKPILGNSTRSTISIGKAEVFRVGYRKAKIHKIRTNVVQS